MFSFKSIVSPCLIVLSSAPIISGCFVSIILTLIISVSFCPLLFNFSNVIEILPRFLNVYSLVISSPSINTFTSLGIFKSALLKVVPYSKFLSWIPNSATNLLNPVFCSIFVVCFLLNNIIVVIPAAINIISTITIDKIMVILFCFYPYIPHLYFCILFCFSYKF